MFAGLAIVAKRDGLSRNEANWGRTGSRYAEFALNLGEFGVFWRGVDDVDVRAGSWWEQRLRGNAALRTRRNITVLCMVVVCVATLAS